MIDLSLSLSRYIYTVAHCNTRYALFHARQGETIAATVGEMTIAVTEAVGGAMTTAMVLILCLSWLFV